MSTNGAQGLWDIGLFMFGVRELFMFRSQELLNNT